MPAKENRIVARTGPLWEGTARLTDGAEPLGVSVPSSKTPFVCRERNPGCTPNMALKASTICSGVDLSGVPGSVLGLEPSSFVPNYVDCSSALEYCVS